MRTPLLTRLPFAALFVTLLLGTLSGCGGGGKGDKNSVSGKVTLNGQPVTGQVTFVGADQKEFPSPIGADGGYKVVDVPKGEYTILVKGQLQGVAPKNPPGGVGGGDLLGGGKGNNPPVKYATAAGGLKFTVTGGDQTHDIPLSP